MSPQTVIDIGANTAWLSIQIAAPALLATMFTGLIISILQAATQINEQTLAFIPKVLAITAAAVFFGPWIVEKMMTFTIALFKQIPNLTL